ncbi:MAG: GNAT family N-acetyltransferase [Bdellovibrionaceae bacterium]|nr:GNAT family N-acetyltransferase [Pseudobdellovibrionaceae bacterium]
MIDTKRCLLITPTKDDAQATVDFYLRNKEHLAPWDPKAPDDFYTEAYWKEKLESYKKEVDDEKSLRLNIWLKEGNILIGMINFTNIERGPFHNCRVGYKVDVNYEGQGFMSESFGAAIKYLFHELNIHRIEANYIPANARSGYLLKRLGFTKLGVAKNYLRIDGKWQDHVLTSLTNENWRES